MSGGVRAAIVLLVVAAAVTVVVLRGGGRETLVESETALPRLVDLGSDKCAQCKMMKPILDDLREEYAGRMDVLFLDVYKVEGAAEKYGVDVIPTQIFLDAEGKELFRHVGLY